VDLIENVPRCLLSYPSPTLEPEYFPYIGRSMHRLLNEAPSYIPSPLQRFLGARG
jgi:hypothetical protein